MGHALSLGMTRNTKTFIVLAALAIALPLGSAIVNAPARHAHPARALACSGLATPAPVTIVGEEAAPLAASLPVRPLAARNVKPLTARAEKSAPRTYTHTLEQGGRPGARTVLVTLY